MKRKLFIFSLLAFLTIGLSACAGTSLNQGPVIKETLSRKNFDSLRVNASTSNVQLIASNHAKVYYDGPDKVKPKISIKKGTLVVTQKNLGSDISIGSGNNVIKIYVPKKLLTLVSIQAENGNVDGTGNISAKHINFNSSNGNINLATLITTDGVANAGNGNITISNLKSIAGFNIYTSNGYAKINNCNASGFNLYSGNGEVTIDAGIASTNGNSNDEGTGGSYKKNIHSKNVLHVVSDNGDVTVR